MRPTHVQQIRTGIWLARMKPTYDQQLFIMSSQVSDLTRRAYRRTCRKISARG